MNKYRKFSTEELEDKLEKAKSKEELFKSLIGLSILLGALSGISAFVFSGVGNISMACIAGLISQIYACAGFMSVASHQSSKQEDILKELEDRKFYVYEVSTNKEIKNLAKKQEKDMEKIEKKELKKEQENKSKFNSKNKTIENSETQEKIDENQNNSNFNL